MRESAGLASLDGLSVCSLAYLTPILSKVCAIIEAKCAFKNTVVCTSCTFFLFLRK